MTQTASAPVSPRRRSSLHATWLDMVRTLVVIVAIVAGLVLLVPRPQRVDQPAVDVASAASAAGRTLGYPVAVPRGLPGSWVPTSAQVIRDDEGVRAWAISYRTPSGYAGFRQAKDPTPRWESLIVADGEEGATETIGGLPWLHRDRPDRGTTSLVFRAPRLTAITTSLGSRDDAGVLAAAVAPSLSDGR